MKIDTSAFGNHAQALRILLNRLARGVAIADTGNGRALASLKAHGEGKHEQTKLENF
jgi:hypothetical protein